MKLINLGLLFSAAFCSNQEETLAEVTTLSGNSTIMGRCFDIFNYYGKAEIGPMVKGRKYRIGTIKHCGNKWYAGLMQWKAFHHGWPNNPDGTWSWGVYQDTLCNAEYKAFVRLGNDEKMYDDETKVRYAYTDDTGRPKTGGSAICSLVECYNDLHFIPTTKIFNVDGRLYTAYKWRKNSAESSRKFFDLKCSVDDVISTSDHGNSYFFLLY
ncbi:hypothetical protein CONCODRAFT_12220 [Conidiobolus coronatus NRRL 28638]|uniref:Uncharacterized protein n=1 Tax=Conidiobolus coronatus (strain ATCC 28846 / CBS 209.66 / NRRL 28638) TaxID=796925 RepID=A0A137NTK0_CONC2|nr:hypothetical protein CONCODRAFT_12220 [Conidiobolus coronatus NRRL 28638]|eukprot:KXN66028.1 hypothetical protein CONCODRAFT_12220 [Conidiobolus coronatus NRRL 28638]